MSNTNSKSKTSKTRLIAGIGMLTAVGTILQYIEISIPIIPSFIKLDFADLSELIGAFAYGPVAGILIALFRNLIHMAVSQSGYVGELSNFILGAVFALVAGLIYQRKKTKKGAAIAGVAGAAAMAAVSLPSNYFLIYPMYYKLLAPQEVVLGLYQALMPSLKNMIQALLVFNVPFTLVKALICAAAAMLIYKPLSKVLKGKN